jgi:hypothetical protein
MLKPENEQPAKKRQKAEVQIRCGNLPATFLLDSCDSVYDFASCNSTKKEFFWHISRLNYRNNFGPVLVYIVMMFSLLQRLRRLPNL